MNDIPKKMVAYYRLSKPKKGKNKQETIKDAYGLEAQRRDVARLLEKYGAELVAEFQEIETGTNKKEHREELEKALLLCQMHKATLVIGKQDRLGRNVHYVSGLMEQGIHIMCADAPEQSPFIIHIRASMDEEEAVRISSRTKDGLEIARAQGKLLGSARPGHWDGREHLRGFKQATAASAKARTRRARRNYEAIIGLIVQWQAEGVSYEIIAERLNARKYLTLGNKPFTFGAVRRVMLIFGRQPIKHEFVLAECSQCHKEVRVIWQKTPRKVVCHRCQKETVLV